MLITPEFLFQDVTHITPEFLRRQGILGLVLDVDNTLALHDAPELRPDIAAWLAAMRAEGVHLAIASNNGPARVRPFAEKLGLEWIAKAKKPLPGSLAEACRRWGLTPAQLAMVGDQLFTDRMAGALGHSPALVVLPLGPETKWYITVKRWFEAPFMARYFKNGGKVL